MRPVPAQIEIGCPECGATVEVRLRAWVAVLSSGGRLVLEQAYQAPHTCVEPTFRVVLLETGEKKIQVIKAIREVTGLGLRESDAHARGRVSDQQAKCINDLRLAGAHAAVVISVEEAERIARAVFNLGEGEG